MVKAVHGAHNGRGSALRQAFALGHVQIPRPTIGLALAHSASCIRRESLAHARSVRARISAVNEALTPSSHSWSLQVPEVYGARRRRFGGSMRSIIAVAVFAASLVSASAAQAERRVFIIANNGDGYGIDRCLASGASCGEAAANSYCRSREFSQALSYRKVDRDDITGAIPASGPGSCHGAICDDFVAITCAR